MKFFAPLLLFFLLTLPALLIPAVSPQAAAISIVRPDPNIQAAAGASIIVTFLQNPGDTGSSINVTAKGITPGTYAIHIHTYGDTTSLLNFPKIQTNNSGIGGHWNPDNAIHGCLGTDMVRHVGDIGNITVVDADPNNWNTYMLTSELIRLDSNYRSIIGRAVSIHSSYDRCAAADGFGGSDTNGNAGTPMAQGVVGIMTPSNPLWPTWSFGSSNIAITYNAQSPKSAVAVLRDTAGAIKGVIRFQNNGDGTHQVMGTITGLTPFSIHGIHVHQYGDEYDVAVQGAAQFLLAGGHFAAATGQHHALPVEDPFARHFGDMGNHVKADRNGNAFLNFSINLLSIQGTDIMSSSVIGRGVVVHSAYDQGMAQQPTGASGSRLLFGVIGYSANDLTTNTLLLAGQQTQDAPYSGKWLYAGAVVRGNPNFQGSNDGSKVLVTVSFAQYNAGNVTIVVNATGLNPGTYGLHIHTYGDLTSPFIAGSDGKVHTDGTGIGPHFNPDGLTHGCQEVDGLRHVGDVGNFVVSQGTPLDGMTSMTFVSELLDITPSPRSIVGRAVSFHSAADLCGANEQGGSNTTGNAGTPLATGVVGILNPSLNPIITDPTTASTWASQNTLTTAPVSLTATMFNASNQVQGVVRIHDNGDGTHQVTGYVRELAPNTWHGIHVHQYGDDFDLSLQHVASATFVGAHFDPLMTNNHALPSENATGRHEGDMGNFYVGADGTAAISLTVNLLDSWTSISTLIIGRSVVIHEMQDQGYAKQPLGAAGNKILVGIIGISNNAVDTAVTLPNYYHGGAMTAASVSVAALFALIVAAVVSRKAL